METRNWPENAIEAHRWWSEGRWTKAQFDRYTKLVVQGDSRSRMEGSVRPLYTPMKRVAPKQDTWWEWVICIVAVIIIFVVAAWLMGALDMSPQGTGDIYN